jgi:hypothetical protein
MSIPSPAAFSSSSCVVVHHVLGAGAGVEGVDRQVSTVAGSLEFTSWTLALRALQVTAHPVEARLGHHRSDLNTVHGGRACDEDFSRKKTASHGTELSM